MILKDGRQLLATVPSIDGFECAGWDMLVSARDVIEACERDNVRPGPPPPAPHRPVCTDSH
jgi:hypothetical protein